MLTIIIKTATFNCYKIYFADRPAIYVRSKRLALKIALQWHGIYNEING